MPGSQIGQIRIVPGKSRLGKPKQRQNYEKIGKAPCTWLGNDDCVLGTKSVAGIHLDSLHSRSLPVV